MTKKSASKMKGESGRGSAKKQGVNEPKRAPYKTTGTK